MDKLAAAPFRLIKKGSWSIERALIFITMQFSVMAMSCGASEQFGISKVLDATGSKPSFDHSVNVTSRAFFNGN